MKPCVATGWLLALLVLSLSACGGTDVPDVLHVVRTELPGYHFVDLNRVIHDAALVQDLYKAAYTLKAVQPGTMSCPADLGLEYHLAFLRGTTSVQQMDLDATGCQLLHINAQDARFTSPSFQALLAKVLNLSSLIPSCAFRTPMTCYGRTAYALSIPHRFTFCYQTLFLSKIKTPQAATYAA